MWLTYSNIPFPNTAPELEFVEMVPNELLIYLISRLQSVKTSKRGSFQVQVTDSWLLHHWNIFKCSRFLSFLCSRFISAKQNAVASGGCQVLAQNSLARNKDLFWKHCIPPPLVGFIPVNRSGAGRSVPSSHHKCYLKIWETFSCSVRPWVIRERLERLGESLER